MLYKELPLRLPPGAAVRMQRSGLPILSHAHMCTNSTELFDSVLSDNSSRAAVACCTACCAGTHCLRQLMVYGASSRQHWQC